MALPGIVAFDAVRLVLADAVPSRGQGSVIRCPIVGAEQAHAPGLHAAEQPVQGKGVAVAAFPVDQPAAVTLERLPDPELAGFF